MKIGDTIRDEKLQYDINPNLGGGGGKGVFLPSVGFPVITQKQ